MKAALKSWKTSIVGVAIFGVFVFAAVTKDTELAKYILGVLFSAGFILSKDGSATHSSAPDKPDNPEPNI